MGIYSFYYIYIWIFVQELFLANSLQENATVRDSGVNDDLQLSTLNLATTTEVTNLHNVTIDPEFATCGAFELGPDEYIMLPNGSARVDAYNKTYDPSSYRLSDGYLLVCPPEHESDDSNSDIGSRDKFGPAFAYITVIGLGISMICLVFHLIAFFIVPDMRNLPGYNLASLSFSLLFGYAFFIIGNAASIKGTPCVCIAAATQFFLLSSFLWMSTMGLDVFRSLLKATGKLRLASRKFSCKKYCIYCFYSWGTPLLFVTATLVLDNVEGIPDEFRPVFGTAKACWFGQKIPLAILFAAPLILVILSNTIFFGLSAYIIFANRMRMKGDEAYKNMLKTNFLMYSRLATIMGLAWITGIIGSLADTMWSWYIFIILNTLQGFFIFLAFTCNHKVKKHVVARLNSRKRKMSSVSSPTFQSYWNTALSMDNDVDFTSQVNIVMTEKV